VSRNVQAVIRTGLPESTQGVSKEGKRATH